MFVLLLCALHTPSNVLLSIIILLCCNLLPPLHECVFAVFRYVCNSCLPDTGLRYTHHD